MVPKTIMIDDQKYVRESDIGTLAEPVEGLRYCIVRCRDAGVHAGFVKERNGREVTLLKTRRLWKWHGKTLSGLANEGTTNSSYCKYSNEIPEITVLDACEIIPCSDKGMKSIQNVKEWTNE
jgi:hypothetical protein